MPVSYTHLDVYKRQFRDGSDPIRFPSSQWTDYIMGDATLQSQHNMNISGGTASSDQDRKEEILEAAEILIKYQGYIDRERMIAEKLARLESINCIPRAARLSALGVCTPLLP